MEERSLGKRTNHAPSSDTHTLPPPQEKSSSSSLASTPRKHSQSCFKIHSATLSPIKSIAGPPIPPRHGPIQPHTIHFFRCSHERGERSHTQRHSRQDGTELERDEFRDAIPLRMGLLCLARERTTRPPLGRPREPARGPRSADVAAQAAAVTLAGLLKIWSARQTGGLPARVGRRGRNPPRTLLESTLGAVESATKRRVEERMESEGRLSHRGTTLGTLFPLYLRLVRPPRRSTTSTTYEAGTVWPELGTDCGGDDGERRTTRVRFRWSLLPPRAERCAATTLHTALVALVTYWLAAKDSLSDPVDGIVLVTKRDGNDCIPRQLYRPPRHGRRPRSTPSAPSSWVCGTNPAAKFAK